MYEYFGEIYGFLFSLDYEITAGTLKNKKKKNYYHHVLNTNGYDC